MGVENELCYTVIGESSPKREKGDRNLAPSAIPQVLFRSVFGPFFQLVMMSLRVFSAVFRVIIDVSR